MKIIVEIYYEWHEAFWCMSHLIYVLIVWLIFMLWSRSKGKFNFGSNKVLPCVIRLERLSLLEKCPHSELFWSVFSRIRTLFTLCSLEFFICWLNRIYKYTFKNCNLTFMFYLGKLFFQLFNFLCFEFIKIFFVNALKVVLSLWICNDYVISFFISLYLLFFCFFFVFFIRFTHAIL